MEYKEPMEYDDQPISILEFLSEEPADLGDNALDISHPRTQDSID